MKTNYLKTIAMLVMTGLLLTAFVPAESAMKEIATAINKEKAAEMKTVLNEEQHQIFEEMQADQAKRQGRRKGGRKRAKSN